jgi:hypothetical protein
MAIATRRKAYPIGRSPERLRLVKSAIVRQGSDIEMVDAGGCLLNNKLDEAIAVRLG